MLVMNWIFILNGNRLISLKNTVLTLLVLLFHSVNTFTVIADSNKSKYKTMTWNRKRCKE